MPRILTVTKLVLDMVERKKKNAWEIAFLSIAMLGLTGLSLIPFAYVYSILR